jgi:DNA modification methylase
LALFRGVNRRAGKASRWLAENMNLYHGDCLEVLPTFPPASVEAIITDLPYGTTACEWDSIIPLAPMWEQVKRVLKPSGVFITTSAQPFTSVLIVSNLSMFRYDVTWDKVTPTGFLNCDNAPLRSHESIVIFYQAQPTYNPQMIKKPYKGSRTGAGFTQKGESIKDGVYGSLVHGSGFRSDMSYPKSVWEFPTGNGHTKSHYEHPTQKPVNLYEYIIRTYTNAGETVLDICMGSGTTGVAAVQTGRNFIGIEKEQKYFEIASRRIAQAPQPLFTEPPRQPTQREPDLKLESGKLSGFE